jgi:deoxyribose-phosphate aldolase
MREVETISAFEGIQKLSGRRHRKSGVGLRPASWYGRRRIMSIERLDIQKLSARQELARLIEHALLAGDATHADIERLCGEARTHGFASVCVPGSRVVQAVHFLQETEIKVACAVGHPLGAGDADVKRYETEVAIDSGAHFVEVTANFGRLKDGDDAYVLREFRDVVEAADERPVSVALDITILAPDDFERAANLAIEADAKGISLSGGSDLSAAMEAVRRIRQFAKENFGLKVNRETLTVSEAVTLVEAGATRFGLEQSVKLIEELR